MSSSYSAVDLQKIKLEKLMQNIDKEVEIPERSKERQFPEPPDFIRNIMGSSAGAGSGEFHVYRHLRRKEFARQRFIEEQAKREEMDANYKAKLEENMRLAEERTAKKRAKRLKKKGKKRLKKKNESVNDGGNEEDSDDENDEQKDEEQKDEEQKDEEQKDEEQKDEEQKDKKQKVEEKSEKANLVDTELNMSQCSTET